jgi:hypothetical protein
MQKHSKYILLAVATVAMTCALVIWRDRSAVEGRGTPRTSPGGVNAAMKTAPGMPVAGPGSTAPALKTGERRVEFTGFLPGETMEARLTRMRNADWMTLRAAVVDCAGLDPRATAVWAAANLPAGGERAFALRHALSKWTALDPREALAWASKLSTEQGRESALRDVFYAWASQSPESAAEQLKLAQDFRTRSLATAAVAYYWAEKDLNAATKWAWDLPENAGRTYALANIARRLFYSDGQAAKEWAQKLPESRARNETILELAGLLAMKDPVSAADWLEKEIPGGPGPDPAFQILVARWAAGNQAEAVAWASQLPDDGTREHALATIAQALGPHQPQIAASVAVSMPAGQKKEETIYKVASIWARTDASAASDWAAGLAAGPEQKAAQEAIAKAEAASQPPAATEPSAEPSAPAASDTATGNSANRLSQEVFQSPWWELVPLVEQLPDGVLREGLAHRTAVEWAKEDPKAAASWISEQLAEGRALDTALRVIVWNWTLKDAAAATAWEKSLTDAHTREHAVLSSAMALARSTPDPAVLSGLLESIRDIPPDDTRRQAVGNIAYQWARTAADIGSVTNWAAGLSEEEGRSIALEQIRKAVNAK